MSFLLEGVITPVLLLLLDLPGPIKDTVGCVKDTIATCFTPRSSLSAKGRAEKARRVLEATKAAARDGREVVKPNIETEIVGNSDEMATKTMSEVSKLFSMIATCFCFGVNVPMLIVFCLFRYGLC